MGAVADSGLFVMLSVHAVDRAYERLASVYDDEGTGEGFGSWLVRMVREAVECGLVERRPRLGKGDVVQRRVALAGVVYVLDVLPNRVELVSVIVLTDEQRVRYERLGVESDKLEWPVRHPSPAASPSGR